MAYPYPCTTCAKPVNMADEHTANIIGYEENGDRTEEIIDWILCKECVRDKMRKLRREEIEARVEKQAGHLKTYAERERFREWLRKVL
jgi:hypothetical protein